MFCVVEWHWTLHAYYQSEVYSFQQPPQSQRSGGGREGHLSLYQTVYIGWNIAPLPHLNIDKCTSMHTHTQILKPSLTLTDIHTSTLTHIHTSPQACTPPLFPLQLIPSKIHTHTHTYSRHSAFTTSREQKRWKMSQIMSERRQHLSNASMGPRCARTGWRFYDCCWT